MPAACGPARCGSCGRARRNRHWAPGQPLGNGQWTPGAVIVAVRAGVTVVVRVAPAGRSRFQFLRTLQQHRSVPPAPGAGRDHVRRMPGVVHGAGHRLLGPLPGQRTAAASRSRSLSPGGSRSGWGCRATAAPAPANSPARPAHRRPSMMTDGVLAAPRAVLPRSWPAPAIYQREHGVSDLVRHAYMKLRHDHGAGFPVLPSGRGKYMPGECRCPVLRSKPWCVLEAGSRPAGGSPARVGTGAPGSRPRFVAERRRAERGVESLFGGSKRAGRSVKRILQPRQIHNGGAEPLMSRRRPCLAGPGPGSACRVLSGVWGVARAHGLGRNRRDPSAWPASGKDRRISRW